MSFTMNANDDAAALFARKRGMLSSIRLFTCWNFAVLRLSAESRLQRTLVEYRTAAIWAMRRFERFLRRVI